jgi:hypothetical protein
MAAMMQQCIQNCQDCHRSCLALVPHCLQLGGAHAAADHIVLLLDCADSCAASVDFMLRGSSFHGPVCGVCAAVCARCAESCARFADDAQMQECAAVCRRCAESCRQMAAMA